MTKRITKVLAALAALAALGLGGAALAGAVQDKGQQRAPHEASEPEGPDGAEGTAEKGDEATGPEADRAKQAALQSTGGGEATSVQRDEPDGAEKPDAGEKDDQRGFRSPGGSVWEVEVTTADGRKVDVYLDKGYKVLTTAPAEQD